MQMLKTPHYARGTAHAPAPGCEHRRGILTLRALLVLCSVGAVTLIGAATSQAQAAGLCAYHEKTTADGLVATSTFHVVRDGCTVSLVSIEHFASGAAIVDTATARNLKASDTRYTLTVNLRCGRNTEADLVLGEPLLFPAAAFDLQATPFRIACGAPAPAPAAAAAPAAAPVAAPASAPTVLSTPAPIAPLADKKSTSTAWTATPQPVLPTCKDTQKLVNGKCVVKAEKKHTSSKPSSAKKKKRAGVLGAKKTKNLPFTK